MTAVPVLQKPSRARWLARRKKGITATDVPAIFGYHPWITPLDVWLGKTGRMDEVPDHYAMRRGAHMERFLADEYARETGAHIETPPKLVAHPEHRLLLASLDRLAHHPDRTVVLELKTTSTWDGWLDNALPDHITLQVLHQLAVTGLDEAVVYADVCGRLQARTVMRDPEWEESAHPLLARWWREHVLDDVAPAADWERDTIQKLNRAYPTGDDTVEADTQLTHLINLACVQQQAANTTDAAYRATKVQIRELMRDARRVTVGGRTAAQITSAGQFRLNTRNTKETP